MASQFQWKTAITVTDGQGPMELGLADKWSGGGKESEAKVYARARGDLTLAGKASREDGKATYLFADIAPFDDRLDRGVDLNLPARITRWQVGDDGQPVVGGRTVTLVGKLKAYSGTPEGDAGGDDGATCELTFTLEKGRA